MTNRPDDRPEQPMIGRRAFISGTAALTSGSLLVSVSPGAAAASDRDCAQRAGPVATSIGRSSRYVTVRDGTKIAIDILAPMRGDAALPGRHPVVVACTGYRRAWILSANDVPAVHARYPSYRVGDLLSFVTSSARFSNSSRADWSHAVAGEDPEAVAAYVLMNGSSCEYLILHGYVVVVMDTRATGASFGKLQDLQDNIIGRDLSDVFDWIVEQDWAEPKIGMLGASWLGAVQHMAVTYGSRHLRAVMPQVAPFDQYLGVYPGGMFNVGLMRDWLALRESQDKEVPALPVDADTDGALLAAARAERSPATPGTTGPSVEQIITAQAMLTRDQFDAASMHGHWTFVDGTTGRVATEPLDFERARRSGIAIYCWGGWWDIYARETPMSFANLSNPKKLTMGPWNHGNEWDVTEALRWFDHWLRGIDNGIGTEPPVTYAVGRPGRAPRWCHDDVWPPASMAYRDLHLTAASPQGRLTAEPDSTAPSTSSFTVDYSATAGPGARAWGFSMGPQLDYSALHSATSGRLIFEAEATPSPLIIAGYPLLEVTVASSGSQAALFAYLESVAPDGASWTIAEGNLDLRHREVATAPYRTLGVPFRRFSAASMQAIRPGRRMTAVFELTPISWEVPPGHRLRLILTGADAANSWQAAVSPPPSITVHGGPHHLSRLRVPVVAADSLRDAKNAFTRLPSTSWSGIKPTMPPQVMREHPPVK